MCFLLNNCLEVQLPADEVHTQWNVCMRFRSLCCWLCILRTLFHLFFLYTILVQNTIFLSISGMVHFSPATRCSDKKSIVTDCNNYTAFPHGSQTITQSLFLFFCSPFLRPWWWPLGSYQSSPNGASVSPFWAELFRLEVREDPLGWGWFADGESPIEAHRLSDSRRHLCLVADP